MPIKIIWELNETTIKRGDQENINYEVQRRKQ